MAIERSWELQGPVAFTADGGLDGLVIVSSVECFKVKQRVVISATSLPDLVLQIKRVNSLTNLIVGPLQDKTHPAKPKDNLLSREDISAYTTALGATIRAAEQPKVRLDPRDIIQAVYEQEPTVALRTIGVDKIGKPWGDGNPLPVTGTFVATSDDPTAQEIQNISMPLANTEYTISLPDDTKRYQIRIRRDLAGARLAFVIGETATNYWTLTRGTIVDSYVVNLPIASKLYLMVDKADQVTEVMAWVKP